MKRQSLEKGTTAFIVRNTSRFMKDPALYGTAIVTVGLFVGHILSYTLQLVLGRLLTLSEFGTFTALLSLGTIFTLPNNAFTNSIIKVVSELKATNRFDKLTILFWRLSSSALLLGLFAFIFLFAFRDFILGYLNITDLSLMHPFGFFVVSSLVVMVPIAYLQGLLRYKAFSFFNIVSGLLKVVISVLLVILGFGVGGVYVGVGLSFTLAFVLSLFLLRKNFRQTKKINLSDEYKRLMSFGAATLLVSLGMILLNNVDIILVKHYFDAETAGVYSALVTVGKVFLFGAGTVFIVMYPQISELATKKENYLEKFKSYLVIQISLIAFCILIFSLFPELIITVLFGQKFLPAAIFLPKFSIFVGIYVLTSFMIMFFLAINKTRIYLLQIPAIILQLFLIILYHSTIDIIINVNILVSFLLLIGIVLYYWYNVGFTSVHKS